MTASPENMAQFRLRLKDNSYPIVIGTNLHANLVKQLSKSVGQNRLFVFYDSTVYALYGKELNKLLESSKFQFEPFVVPSGEKYKSEITLAKIYDFLLDEKISRSDFILAVGGGVTSDLIGYAAATILRGVKWGTVSTTLLGMVDAAIGGKTGINHRRGKNLIGAFWHPSFVICDLTFLRTLPEREILAGMGEILKYAALIGGENLELIKRHLNSGNLLNSKTLSRLVEAGVKYKTRIVMADEREKGRRMHLNLGHTFAHAIEKTLGYGKLLHGEAVILGLLAAVKMSIKVRPRSKQSLAEYEFLIINFLGFIRYYYIDKHKVLENMQIDKKRADREQKIVLLKRIGKPFIVTGPNEHQLSEALEECLSIYKKVSG